jgi:hypothetical protein
VIEGAVAGVCATWVMGQVTSYLYEHESQPTRQREDAARGGEAAFSTAAGKLARAARVELTRDQRETAGRAMHWSIGVGAVIGYALVRRRYRPAAALHGVVFGLAFFALVDELLNPLLGFTPGPRAFPWQAHARGLAGHVAFGVASELALDGMDRVPVSSAGPRRQAE